MSVATYRPRRLAAALLLTPLLAVSGLGAWTPVRAADGLDSVDGYDGTVTIDHAQPTQDGIRLLVSVPAGTETVDYDSIGVSIGGKAVDTQAVAASDSDAIKRVSILAIDTSESMKGSRIAEAKKAATTYLDSAPDNVQIGVLTFDDTVKLLVAPGLDRAAARDAIDGLTLTHNTALYEGVLGALEATGPGGAASGQRQILVLSDGKDTTTTSLSRVVDKIASSKVLVDAVSLQQSDADSGPLREIVTAGKGTLLDASEPAALSAAFAKEADELTRQIVVTAQVPASASKNANVQVTVPSDAGNLTASAYLLVRGASNLAASVTPTPVTANALAVSQRVVLGGIVAMAVGLLGIIIALGMRKPPPDTDDRLSEQMRAYGMYATPGAPSGPPVPAGQGLADQARQAAERALASNKSLEAKLEARLEAAGVAFRPSEWLLLRAGVAVGLGLLGVLVGSGNIALGAIFIVLGLVAPPVYLKFKRRSRLRAFAGNLPDTLQLMSGSLSAGLSLAQSIDTIVREGNEPIASEFKRVVVESRLGVPLEDSLDGVAERMESRDWAWVVMAIRIQREVGGNLAELLLQVAETLREREFLRRHVRALSAEGRLSAYILGGLPPAFLLYLTVTKPDYVHPLYSSTLGFILDIGMVVLLGVGVLWMSKVAKVEM